MADQSMDFKIRLTAEDRAQASLKAAAAAIKEVEAAQRSANTAAQAWQTLGARSGDAIRADMEQVKAALASIRGSGAPIEEMGRATQAASMRLRELGRELALVEKPITGIERLFSKVTQAFLALQVVLQGAEIANAADNFEKLRITLAQSEGSMQGAQRALDELYRIAQSASVPIEAMTVSYQRYTRAVAAMGGSQQQALDFTEALAKALRLSNATAQETGSVMRQLSQAFNKGKLNGDEFVSVSENGGRVLDYLARQIGKSRGELQEMSKAGELTDKVLLQLGQALEKIRGDFDLLPKNFADAWVNFRNALITTLGESEAFQGVMGALTSTLLALANHVDLVLVALGTLGAAWVMHHTSIGMLIVLWGGLTSAISAATVSTHAFTAALWGLAKHPAVLVLGAIVTYLAYDYVAAWLSGEKAQTSALDSLKAKLNEAERKLAELDGAVLRSKQTLEGLFESLGKTYDELDDLGDERLGDNLDALREGYARELADLKALVKDKDKARDEETRMLMAQIGREYHVIQQASEDKLVLFRQEYTQRMAWAAKASISTGQREEREAEAQATLLKRLKALWAQEADEYKTHLQQLESLANEHLNRIQDLEQERIDGNKFIEKEIAAIQERSYAASNRLFAEKKSQEQEIAALRAKVAQGDRKAMEELTRLYKEQAEAAKQASRGLILERGKNGEWLSREDVRLMNQLTELQALFNQGKEEQIRQEDEARVAAQVQIELMRDLVAQSVAFGQNVVAAVEEVAKLKLGVDTDAFNAEIDQLVGLLAQRDDVKLKVKLISDQIDALKVINTAEQKLAKTPVPVPVQLRSPLGGDLDAALAGISEAAQRRPPAAVPVTAEVKDPDAVVQTVTRDLARTPATLIVAVDPSQAANAVASLDGLIQEREVALRVRVDPNQVTNELASLDGLIQEREVWMQVRAGTEKALADLQAFQAQASAGSKSSHIISTNARAALAEILSLNGRNTKSYHHIYNIYHDAAGGPVGLAIGGQPRFPRRQGYILGPGTETSDSIPAMLSRGEFVLRAAAVRKWGLGFLHALNRGFLPKLPRLAGGGMPVPAVASPAGLPEMAINLSIQGGSPLRMMSSRETARNLASALRNLERGR